MERGVIQPPVDAKEPKPFLPAWSCTIGPLNESGAGLLSPHVFKNRHAIDELNIHLGECVLRVFPRTACIMLDSRVVFQGGPVTHELVWFRRMEQQIASWDVNTRAAQCLWYGVGLKWAEGQHGYRLHHDGRITQESIA